MKAYLAAVLEDLVGEYVLNISKENLKLAALRGKIKLENVELDGDFIGSHILGAVGLSGFGVLSCWARTLKINIPWTNLDAPASLEIRGMHLVCVPLLPSTANRTYYGSQTLRTRAKRASLARLERNFFSGRIAGEGPQQDKNDGQALSYHGRRRRWSSSEDVDGKEDDDVGDGIELSLNGSIQKKSGRGPNSSSTKKEKEAGLPALKKKIKAKIYENLVSSVNEVHIRCEIPAEGLNMSLPQKKDISTSSHGNSDQRAFAFGLTLKSVSVTNASEVESSENGLNSEGLDQSQTSTTPTRQDSGSSSISDGGSKTHKKVEIEDLSMYWDDDPSFLITESDLLNGHLSLPVATCQRRIADAMKRLSTRKDPGFDTKLSLTTPGSPSKYSPSRVENDPGHDYICSAFSQTMLTTLASDASGNSLCFAELLPCRLDLNVTSQQYKQYQLLKNAVLSQQRTDTMLHRRPQKTPTEDPRAWWKYAIACVKHNPTSRSWKEVQKICHCRDVYLKLVVKNLSSEAGKSGFHGGLQDDESNVLVELENMLPIETLSTFHLIALRTVVAKRGTSTIGIKTPRRSSMANSFAKKRSSSTLGRLLNSISGSANTWQSLEDEAPYGDDELPMFLSPFGNDDAPPVMPKQRRTSSDGRARTPTTQKTCQLHVCKVRVSLLESVNGRKIITVEFDVKGSSYSSDTGMADLTFDIVRFEVFDFVTSDNDISSGKKVLAIEPDIQDFDCTGTVIENDSDESPLPILSSLDNTLDENSEMRLPPNGVVCQITTILDQMSLSFNLSAHPTTLIWNNACADRVADFFSSSTYQIQNDFLRQLRNATTPESRRSQMAVLYPTSLSINVDAHAPKVWIPISPQMLDGALFLDAGKLKITLSKPEQSSETIWNMDVQDIQIMLAGETTGTVLGGEQDDAADLDGVARLIKSLTTIIHPFQINLKGNTSSSFDEPLKMEPEEEVHPPINSFDNQTEIGSGQISVKVGRIRLNLVDVEELAKAIGRFYASGVVMMKNKSLSEPTGNPATDHFLAAHPETPVFEIVQVCFDKVEIALERYSSQRTYLVEIFSITLDKKNKAKMSFSRLSISNFTIVQLSDTNHNRSDSNVRYLKPSSEPQHQLLGRKPLDSDQKSEVGSSEEDDSQPLIAPQTPRRKGKSPSETSLRTPKQLRFTSEEAYVSPALASDAIEFIRGCHFHDGENHIDEVELDVKSAIIKVTPTSISDCTMWLARAIELARIASKEMERRVHDRGRKARTEDKNGESYLKTKSSKEHVSSIDSMGLEARDSSVIFRVTFSETSVLIGRPASEFACSRGRRPTDYVVQIVTNASIMTQSIENDDGTGARTFHLSMVDLAASVNPHFQYVSMPDDPMLSTAVDCRMVHDTVGEGYVSSQDFSFDCESMFFTLTPHDVRVISSVTKKINERLRLKSGPSLSALLHSKKTGSRIATRIRCDTNSLSFILIHSFKSNTSMRPFIEIKASQLKANLEGVVDAMNGEIVALAQVKFFNPNSGSWEDIVAPPNRFTMNVDQIPNELVLSVSSPDFININLTGDLLQEISNLERAGNSSESDIKSVAVITQTSRFNFVNETGMEVEIDLDDVSTFNSIKVPSGSTVSLDSLFAGMRDSCTLSLGAKGRQTIRKLPLIPTSSSKQCSLLYKWQTYKTKSGFSSNPSTIFVMQNQRIRPGINDVFSLKRGQDLLEGTVWSPLSVRISSRSESLWLPPYLKDDAYEWSDMTNTNNTKKQDFVLPDKHWMWANDWEVQVNGDLRTNDADGWEYATDFETFSTPPRSYQRGDLCRRRRWTRTRMIDLTQKNNTTIARISPIVWEIAMEDEKMIVLRARSHLQLHNHTNMDLSFFGFCHSWDKDEYIGDVSSGASLSVPLQQASATHIRLATSKISHAMRSTTPKTSEFFATEQLMILPTGFTSNRIIRASIQCEHNVDGFLSIKTLHFVLTLKCVESVIDLHVEPALKVINLLPCQLQCQLGHISDSVRKGTRKISQTEVLSLSEGKAGNCMSVDCRFSPHISVRLPGYKWSYWKKIVNRQSNSHTWRPTEEEEVALFEAYKDGAETEFKSIVHFDHKCKGGNSIDIVMSLEMSHVPTLKFYAQYWLLDKTGLGLNFTGGFSDLLQTTPEVETLRKSYLLPIEANDQSLKWDIEREGHEWSLGMNGMSLFFSRDERIAISVEGKSRWSHLIDVANVMPEAVKTAISIDQYHGTRRYELAYNITLCSSVFSRTRVITIFPRYQIVNLLQGQSLYIAQEGALSSEMCIPPQSSVLFHWEKRSLDPKVRLCSDSSTWSRGGIQMNKIGVTAMRIPSSTSTKPFVVQAEVRLATKKQDSAVIVSIWASIEKSNPLYLLKNSSQHTIYCRQKLSEEGSSCDDGFIWTLNSGESIGFGFDDPQLPHVIQWTWSNTGRFVSTIEVDAMGSKSKITMWDGNELTCEILAQLSTKVILFSEGAPIANSRHIDDDNDEIVSITMRIDLSGIAMSVIDTVDFDPGREILLLTTEGWHVSFAQNREGFHEMELRLKALQVDNFIFNAEHPVLIFCPSNEDIPFLHLSAVRSILEHSGTLVLSYAALRALDIDICLDRKTAETIVQFLHPLRKARDEQTDINWSSTLTSKMKTRYSDPSKLPRATRDVERMMHTANSGRIYLEKLHLHPLRLSLTFTQEGLEWNPATEGLVLFQLVRGLPSLQEAPLIFTSFVVSHAFESPQTLLGIISAHYSSQLSSQLLTILGSLVILKAPADILSNIGTGVRDFFYEPINGLVHGPAEFLEGLESGTSSLARGVFTGLVRSAASVTELVSHNLANLTDEHFIDERNAYQRKFMHALKADQARRTMQESLAAAGICVARGFRSGVNGIIEQPSIYASRHGTAGLVKGVGKAVVGAIVKPVVGVGDAAVVVMNHVAEITINKLTMAKNNKRFRRALPCASTESGNSVKLIPYDERSARAQQIVTSGETQNDAYLGHVQIPGYLIIASRQYLWIVSEERSDPQRISWAEISNFGIYGNRMQIDVFSSPRSFSFEMSSRELADLFELLSMRMGNSSNSTDLDLSRRGRSYSNLPGIKAVQVGHAFGSVNRHNVTIEASDLTDESEFINGGSTRVSQIGSFMPNFFQRLDQEAWLLISFVSQMFKGLSSRRCIAVGVINGTGDIIQVISSNLIQGGSPCFTLPTIEYDKYQGVLHPGGAIIFLGWGAVPSLLQPGKVLMHIETNLFVCDLSDSISQSTATQVLPSWQVDFLEKSYDENEWWAKYWILIQKKKSGAS